MIIFNSEPGGSPLGIVGVRMNENLFVEADNTWAEGCYLPAFVRRYPFIFISGEENAELAFCVDSLNKRRRSRTVPKRPLIGITAKHCSFFARQQNATRNFVTAVEEQDILIERSADITSGWQKIAMRGFRVVDEGRLRRLPAAAMAPQRLAKLDREPYGLARQFRSLVL